MTKQKIKYTYDRVLLIDDNELDNFINQKILESELFAKKIYVNTSGTSALEFLKNMYTGAAGSAKNDYFPEVIFVDINMPLMDGFQFINHLQKMDADLLKDAKIVILTTSLNPTDKVKAHEISDDIVFMNKPLNRHLLESIASNSGTSTSRTA